MAAYFSIFLVIITVVTGLVWLADYAYFAPKRRLKVANAKAQCAEPLDSATLNKIAQPNALIETSVQVFPVIAFVLVLRSFLYEPFQIPSGSMMPTLLDGDFILVNKFNYGLRDPVARKKFIENDLPERGDVVVFKYPLQPEIDYIKRVIGVPGDRVIYRNKSLYIKPACQDEQQDCPGYTQVNQTYQAKGEHYQEQFPLTRYQSQMFDKQHEILVNNATMARVNRYFKQNGTQVDEWQVPEGQYFVMGDNRDNSFDGRFWGFVPEENLVGEAVAIWMSFDFDNGPDSFLPSWIPTGIRFQRLGGIE
jgi:signal peptidase I